MQAKHLFKCPGPYRNQKGIKYQLKGVSDEDELEIAKAGGWFEDINEAVLEQIDEGFGDDCFFSKRYAKAWKTQMAKDQADKKISAEAAKKAKVAAEKKAAEEKKKIEDAAIAKYKKEQEEAAKKKEEPSK